MNAESQKVNTHGGDAKAAAQMLGMKKTPEIIFDFSVNINPLGAPDCIKTILESADNIITDYPDVMADAAAEALAKAHGVSSESIILGNGSTALLGNIVRSFRPIWPGWITPCYDGYNEACAAADLNGHEIEATNEETGFIPELNMVDETEVDMLFIASPNNPTGTIMNPGEVLEAAVRNPERYIVLDESFMDFLQSSKGLSLIKDDLPENLIVVKSLTKFFAIPGLRLGMACAHPKTIARINEARLPWTVNAIAQAAAHELYESNQYIKNTLETVPKLRATLVQELNKLKGFKVYPSEVNFILVKLPEGLFARELQAELLKKKILIRSCERFAGLGKEYIRLAVRPENEILALINAIREILGLPGSTAGTTTPEPEVQTESPADDSPHSSKANSLMVVGTMSHSGKSILASGLCRYFSNKGRDVAPFKAQNMALNSFVTKDGGEMGRAQVVQAEAARQTPHTDMNPVLLKPVGDVGSQVIVNGNVLGNFAAKDYYAMKEKMKELAERAYDRLEKSHDLIILEGAGSPAEINLQKEDFVNMAMAEYAGASVLLVADIDRGGVFASIHGTVSLLDEKHRSLIKGIIINKFRGDKLLLASGIKQIEQMTEIPVLGVLPLIKDLNIDDEDSLSLDDKSTNKDACLDIVVIRLPRISNHTDFTPLERAPEINLRYVANTVELGTPDLIIIPGTKNTCSDLKFLHEMGWATALMESLAGNIPLFGICGGYQMLGTRVVDPSGVEGEKDDVSGLDLLPLTTVLEESKELAQVEGVTGEALPFTSKDTVFTGYEIHSGRTVSTEKVNAPLTILKRQDKEVNEAAGTISEDGLVFGCYIHGLFDASSMRDQLIGWLGGRKGIKIQDESLQQDDVDSFDRLTGIMEEHLKMNLIDDMVK